ncbi:MAG: hypothetical protein EBS54_00825 [Betaproteobacteria bacterium]|nr:hypothetical protein [Betaproteobacteria bacterium]NBT05338.1 hypothetical protein [Betaproteobacteria bacterium]NDE53142.1 hypothetical protein [Actinomycetota bacterium]NDF51655.1 hypothetical protein [Betaproteobacteria bacterium]
MSQGRFSSKTHVGANAVALSNGPAKPQAVALSYELNAVAPRVLAKGEGLIAEAILSKASEAGIPLKTDPELLTVLMQLDINEFIPPALYAAIAEVLVWAYEVDARVESSRQPTV